MEAVSCIHAGMEAVGLPSRRPKAFHPLRRGHPEVTSLFCFISSFHFMISVLLMRLDIFDLWTLGHRDLIGHKAKILGFHAHKFLIQ